MCESIDVLTSEDFIMPSNSQDESAIYYFGYGPIVNPLVRCRRGCKISPHNVRPAILYDHRLRFVEGGTANVVPMMGWDVKGVLLRFDSVNEWENFRNFDAGYDIKEVSVSIIDETNLDPKNKNSRTFPTEVNRGSDEHLIEEEDHKDESYNGERRNGSDLIRNRHLCKSCAFSTADSGLVGDEDDEGSCSSEEEYSCPFTIGAKSRSQKEDPATVRCLTFAMSDQGSQHQNARISLSGNNGDSCSVDSVFCKPQERYLRLMMDGLRALKVDETYIRDEVLRVNYIPSERDRVADQSYSYKKFPVATKSNKMPKISFAKYKSKLCSNSKRGENATATYFICNRKVLKVNLLSDKLSSDNDLSMYTNNACVKWLRALGHGKGDITLLVHQTFVDPDCLHIPLVDNDDDLTPMHYEWAEHTILLYLERGGVTATTVYELTDSGSNSNAKTRRRSLSTSLTGVGKSVPSLTASMGRRFQKNRFSDVDSGHSESSNALPKITSRFSAPTILTTKSSTAEAPTEDFSTTSIKAKSKLCGITTRLKNLRLSKSENANEV